MTQIFEPQSDDMSDFNPDLEKVVEQEAGLSDGTIVTIQKRVLLSESELLARKETKTQNVLASIETAVLDGTATEEDYTRLDAIYKIKQLKI